MDYHETLHKIVVEYVKVIFEEAKALEKYRMQGREEHDTKSDNSSIAWRSEKYKQAPICLSSALRGRLAPDMSDCPNITKIEGKD